MALTKDIQKSMDKFKTKVSGIKPMVMHFNTGFMCIFVLPDMVVSVRVEDCSLVGKSLKFNVTTESGDFTEDKCYKLDRKQHGIFTDQIEVMVKDNA